MAHSLAVLGVSQCWGGRVTDKHKVLTRTTVAFHWDLLHHSDVGGQVTFEPVICDVHCAADHFHTSTQYRSVHIENI